MFYSDMVSIGIRCRTSGDCLIDRSRNLLVHFVVLVGDCIQPCHHRDHNQCGYQSVLDGRSALFIPRSEEHTSELQSLMPNSYAVFCLKKKKHTHNYTNMKPNDYHNLI